MANFMYLFRSNPTAYRSMSPEQMQQIPKKWMDWKDTLEKNGHIKQLGERLDGTGKVVRGKAKIVNDSLSKSKTPSKAARSSRPRTCSSQWYPETKFPPV